MASERPLSESEIQAVFERLGLGTEERRRQVLRLLDAPPAEGTAVVYVTRETDHTILDERLLPIARPYSAAGGNYA